MNDGFRVCLSKRAAKRRQTGETQMTDAERKAYYRGRSDAFNSDAGFEPSEDYTPSELAEYKRGFRHAAAEDRLNSDTDWD